MRGLGFLFALVLALLISGTASAQEAKGWLGADIQDVTKAEADKFGWDAPHGAKVGMVAAGSPADKSGLKTSDMILSVNRTEIDTASLRGATVVPRYALQEVVEAAKGRRILFIDTCHSGNAYNQRHGSAAYHANIIAYTAARFDQTTKEDDNLGHGVFTFAVVEGLEGRGGIASRRQISTKELADYVIKRVEELAKRRRRSRSRSTSRGGTPRTMCWQRGDEPSCRGHDEAAATGIQSFSV